MSWSQKIKDNFNRIEGSERYLDKKSIPITHRSVPQSWKFECLQFPALIALGAYEACILIDIFQKIETLSLIVMETADDVHRIEMSCRRQSIP